VVASAGAGESLLVLDDGHRRCRGSWAMAPSRCRRTWDCRPSCASHCLAPIRPLGPASRAREFGDRVADRSRRRWPRASRPLIGW